MADLDRQKLSALLTKPQGDGLTVCFGNEPGSGWILKPGDQSNCYNSVAFALGQDQTTGHIEFVPNSDSAASESVFGNHHKGMEMVF